MIDKYKQLVCISRLTLAVLTKMQDASWMRPSRLLCYVGLMISPSTSKLLCLSSSAALTKV